MVNIAVIGAGYWGPNLIRNFNLTANLHTVCDLDDKRLANMKANYPKIKTTKSFQEVIDDKEVDAVVVATPMKTHYKLAKAALEAGKHVFVEKPLAGSVKEAEEIVKLAKDKKLILMVGHTFE
ncbi:MAG: Gfo/Idh/MocA family oxidoreductase, partial [Nanoarchaeota archaeon]|nr:Gfo/Idh/MocA family oxidoreductase [Nanoarchaeota archaeon]